MRFPWNKRADEERERRVEAEKRLEEVVGDWPKVRTSVGAVLDGYNAKAKQMFGGRSDAGT